MEQRRKNPDMQPVDSFDDTALTQNELTRGLRD